MTEGHGKWLGNIRNDVAMVAMTPLITIQILGFKAIMNKKLHENIAMKRILSSDDEQIIDFM